MLGGGEGVRQWGNTYDGNVGVRKFGDTNWWNCR